jgi:Na+/melibiose symporter-like transporter
MLNMHAFNYGLFYATVGVILLPSEAMTMFPGSHAVMLACMLALAGLSQLISPFAGYLSDRQTGKYGRRVPYLLAGNAVLLLMIGTQLPLPCLYPTSTLPHTTIHFLFPACSCTLLWLVTVVPLTSLPPVMSCTHALIFWHMAVWQARFILHDLTCWAICTWRCCWLLS